VLTRVGGIDPAVLQALRALASDLFEKFDSVWQPPSATNPNGVTSPDIRAGMAMVLAALCADGVSTIHNIQQIDRGYEKVEEKLTALGARIERLPD